MKVNYLLNETNLTNMEISVLGISGHKNYGTMKSSLDKIFHGEEKKFFEIEKEGKHQKNGKVKRRKN